MICQKLGGPPLLRHLCVIFCIMYRTCHYDSLLNWNCSWFKPRMVVSIGASNNIATFMTLWCYLKFSWICSQHFFNTVFIGESNSNNSAESRSLVQFFFFTPLLVKTHEAAICNWSYYTLRVISMSLLELCPIWFDISKKVTTGIPRFLAVNVRSENTAEIKKCVNRGY